MKLSALAEAFEVQLRSSHYAELSFEERVGILIDTEWTARENRKLARRLKAAKMRHSACLKNVNFKTIRGLNRQHILTTGQLRLDRRTPQRDPDRSDRSADIMHTSLSH